MSDIFSSFFVMDEESPQYTACMALYIFRDLQISKFIDDTYAVADKNCRRIVNDKIPEEYEHDTQNDDVKKHCLALSYRYTEYGGSIFSKEQWIKKTCRLGICTGQSDPHSIQRNISSFTSSYWAIQKKSISQKIMRESTAASQNLV
jgi:hypothetical protein